MGSYVPLGFPLGIHGPIAFLWASLACLLIPHSHGLFTNFIGLPRPNKGVGEADDPDEGVGEADDPNMANDPDKGVGEADDLDEGVGEADDPSEVDDPNEGVGEADDPNEADDLDEGVGEADDPDEGVGIADVPDVALLGLHVCIYIEISCVSHLVLIKKTPIRKGFRKIHS